MLYSRRSERALRFAGIALLICGAVLIAGAAIRYAGSSTAKLTEAAGLLALTGLGGIAFGLALGFVTAHGIGRSLQKPVAAPAQASIGIPDGPAEAQPENAQLEGRDTASPLWSGKQAGIETLAGGVAHEINNPLTGIVTLTHMLLRQKNLPGNMRSDLETIAEATERVRKIVKGLLDFSCQTDLNLEWTDVNQLCSSTVRLAETRALARNVKIGLELGKGLPMVRLDRDQMQGVLLNMITNALDATSTTGRVTLTTGIGISASNPGRRGIDIACSDTGCGIAPANMDKIFDPFFTTKDVGQGTGLGLAASHGIVERHGGMIYVKSKVGLGSTFTVWLPIEEERTV